MSLLVNLFNERVLELCLQIPCLLVRIGKFLNLSCRNYAAGPTAAGAVRGLIAKFDNQLQWDDPIEKAVSNLKHMPGGYDFTLAKHEIQNSPRISHRSITPIPLNFGIRTPSEVDQDDVSSDIMAQPTSIFLENEEESEGRRRLEAQELLASRSHPER